MHNAGLSVSENYLFIILPARLTPDFQQKNMAQTGHRPQLPKQLALTVLPEMFFF
jgi:hypothetical protein